MKWTPDGFDRYILVLSLGMPLPIGHESLEKAVVYSCRRHRVGGLKVMSSPLLRERRFFNM